jgi:hypothetical protein
MIKLESKKGKSIEIEVKNILRQIFNQVTEIGYIEEIRTDVDALIEEMFEKEKFEIVVEVKTIFSDIDMLNVKIEHGDVQLADISEYLNKLGHNIKVRVLALKIPPFYQFKIHLEKIIRKTKFLGTDIIWVLDSELPNFGKIIGRFYLINENDFAKKFISQITSHIGKRPVFVFNEHKSKFDRIKVI